MPARDPENFAEAHAALAGAHVAYHAGAVSKLLHFVFEDRLGCNIVITEDDLLLHYGTQPASRAVLQLAPGVIRKLLELAETPIEQTGGTQSITVGPGILHAPDSPVRWRFARRQIFFTSTPTQITVFVRADFVASDLPFVPPSIERPIRMIEIDGGCPHCGVVAPSYRELTDGGLVCGPCGRSFTRRVTLPVARVVRQGV